MHILILKMIRAVEFRFFAFSHQFLASWYFKYYARHAMLNVGHFDHEHYKCRFEMDHQKNSIEPCKEMDAQESEHVNCKSKM